MTPGTIVRQCVRPVTILLAFIVGCQDLGWQSKPPPEPSPPPVSNRAADPLLAGTIGTRTLVREASAQPLRGFGLVIGLNGRGSSDSPTVIRDYLIDFMAKQIAPQGGPERQPRLSPEQLVDSMDTAVVEVTGMVPAGARAGTRFDLRVQAIPGTSTRSLEGGLLLPTPMKFWDPAAGGEGLIAGDDLAKAGGPLFVNPFAGTAEGNADADPRRGYILGGGRSVGPRPLRLILPQPSYMLAQRIARRINERFGQEPKVADAQSRGYVVLNTPPQYAQHPERLRDLAIHLYVENQPAFIERRLRELSRAAAGDNANLEDIALIWEGIGRSVISHLQAFYAHPNDNLRYHAARTGARLGDGQALPVVAGMATSGSHSQRLLAIRELGDCDSPQAPLSLAPLLSDPDQEIRIAAYEALLQHRHPTIKSIKFAHLLDPSQINFILDVVEPEARPLIYVRRTRLPRIAVFGSRLSITPPVFYNHAEDAITVHTVAGSDDVQVFAKRGGRLSEQIVVPPRVVDLITALADLPLPDKAGNLRGLGLPCSRVVQILADLCRNETIPARLVLEQTTLTELLGPEVAPERPEGELPSGAAPSADEGGGAAGERREASDPQGL